MLRGLDHGEVLQRQRLRRGAAREARAVDRRMPVAGPGEHSGITLFKGNRPFPHPKNKNDADCIIWWPLISGCGHKGIIVQAIVVGLQTNRTIFPNP